MAALMEPSLTTHPYVSTDLMTLRKTHFTLWRPGNVNQSQKPILCLGKLEYVNNDLEYRRLKEIELTQCVNFPELWMIDARDSLLSLQENQVYYYWFKVKNTNPYDNSDEELYCTDPFATAVDERIDASILSGETLPLKYRPASVILYKGGHLIPCDVSGKVLDWHGERTENLPENRNTVFYTVLPQWAKLSTDGLMMQTETHFQDTLRLVDPEMTNECAGECFINEPYLNSLGVNALEFPSPMNSNREKTFGYGVGNFFAPEYKAGLPKNQISSTSTTDLGELIKYCHNQGVRFIYDAVMAFSTDNPYRYINFSDFFIKESSGDPEEGNRIPYTGDLIKFNYKVKGYKPTNPYDENGQVVEKEYYPAHEFLMMHLLYLMKEYRIDGIKVDSVNNINNYDFLSEIKESCHRDWAEKLCKSEDHSIVIAEDTNISRDLLEQGRSDAIYNEEFKRRVRRVVLGKPYKEESFEETLRKMIDCRQLDKGIQCTCQAINYITSPDLGGKNNERMLSYLLNQGIEGREDVQKRIELSFACLMTSIGMPMILAGEEFADQQNNPTIDICPENNEECEEIVRKQSDATCYSRLGDQWRREVFTKVSRLAKFRQESEALSHENLEFLQMEISEEKKLAVWQRGSGENIVITVANFSNYTTPEAGNSEGQEIIENWPKFDGYPTPLGKKWVEITSARDVSNDWIGKEPVYPWEAKVYALVDFERTML